MVHKKFCILRSTIYQIYVDAQFTSSKRNMMKQIAWRKNLDKKCIVWFIMCIP